ncbi:phospholipid transfer protein isoform X1 [Salmo salar]|uniref:Phospholipid transfer protein isoform X1 n=1 Tax=Salmo salar TaxID=8030 RepID=A0A1S3L9N4_SALSA|nr:phospholipid transfer protein isoform X1 [Salmo salar]
MASCMVSILFLFPLIAAMSAVEPPGCKIRIINRGLEMLKYETQKFVVEELSNITMPEMKGKEGHFQYTIKEVKINELNLTYADLAFQPGLGLLFNVQNSSIALSFRRHILYWLFYDTGAINASAEGVNIHTVLHMTRDELGRLKISNITCDASIAKMKMKFTGTLGRVYDFLATFLTTGMRFLLNQQICPVMNHAGLVLINSLLETIPVRTEVDKYVGIDYSLLSDPVVTSRSLDMDFRMPKDLEMLLRTTYFGTIMMINPALVEYPISLQLELNSAPKTTVKTSGVTVAITAIVTVMVLPPGKAPVQLSSMTIVAKFNAKVSMKGKRLGVHADLRRFKIYSNQSALESLVLIPLQVPLKTMLQISIVPIINNWTKRGVAIPLADGMDFIEEVVEYHNGYLIIGANLHFSKGLREMIERKIQADAENAI